ncbi:hypothetical protein LR48_Vigan10g205000 [Vigna angularis]|nr:hypothetical protein LR48_Vigan10g205000 [Vigna angularis]
MGRARITLKQISNERSRKTTFLRRKTGLMKKISEFSKRCGGEHCLIMYDDNADGDVEAVTSPENPVEIHSMIQKYYETQLKKERPHKTYGIEEFFKNRKKMIEAEISKVHKQISSIKYPTWDPSFVNMEEDQLRALCARVEAKIEACDEGIKLLKNHKNVPSLMQNFSHGQIIQTPIQALDNEISYLLRNMQEGGGDDAWFSFVPNMAQENATATTSHPNQVNCLQNISQSQPLLEDFMELYDKNYEAVDVPLNSINLFSELEVEELIRELSNEGCDNPVGFSSQPHESILPSISAEYQNQHQGGGPLNALPQTNYYDMLF